MASSTTPTRRTNAGSTASGACTSGSTARRSVATRAGSGGAATTSTTAPGLTVPNSENVPLKSAQRSERGADLFREQLRLFPCREVTALVNLVEVAEVGVGASSPRLGRSIDVVWKYRDADR